ncbi:hypothetical protein H072_6694 [Dactylellina haptotyla CBS 200.50]|uniref:ATP-grasp domain-containing protein n=1 Tax=Dactylellina haptotyla (strain CBS 200.50) TaxID=1284197 RepID=S8BJJ9_DACHA|nr:hypothetical protein H072_6694 [Dactylellina haptotyla CBS 200.50]
MSKSLRIALTYDSKADQIARGCTEEEASAYASTVLIDSVTQSLRRLGHDVIDVSHVRNLARRLVAGEGEDWDMVFNLCEGVSGNAKEVQVPALLEAYQIPYTFSDAACLALAADKAKTKIILQYHNIPTSPFFLVPYLELTNTANEPTRLTELLKSILQKSGLELSEANPLFIKPSLEGGSNGIDHKNKLTSFRGLLDKVAYMHTRFPKQDLLVEKFADGREFTAAIIGTGSKARVLGVLEFLRIRPTPASEANPGLDSGASTSAEDDVDFATYKVKSVATAEFFEIVNVTHEDSDEVREVARIGLATFQALGGRDLGRIDIRSIGRGDKAQPQVLEINAITGLRPDNSHVPILAEQEGLTYDELIADIVSQTMQRSGRQ